MDIFISFKRLAQILVISLLAITFSAQADTRDEVILYLNDPAGSAVAAFDESGELCWEEIYTPYGEKTVLEDSFQPIGCGVVPEERGFTSHSEDYETDLVYMQQRYYDPTIGRFLSVDPVGPIVGDPRTVNRYSYAANNPYKYIDPDGRLFGGLNFFNKNLSPQESLEISATSTAAVTVGLGATATVATAATPGPEDLVLGGAVALRGLGALKSKEVYRALRDGENPADGLRARAPGADTSVGSHVMGKKESDLISTTRDKSKATGLFNSGNGVVAIDLNKVSGEVIDVSQGVGRGRVFARTKSHQEVLIRDSGGSTAPIPAEAIRIIQP